VYFDNDQLDVYRTRMERHEGSTLVRVRWYGDVDGHGVPHEDTPRVFIERKTHHESWSVESSVKERFRLDGTDLFKYIDGYLLASPDLNAQAATLARDVSNDELRARGLKPSVGSFYNR
jgi:SPX domain protein involved in polyphosphate accumulation